MKRKPKITWGRLLPAMVLGAGGAALAEEGGDGVTGLYVRGGPGVSLVSETELTDAPGVVGSVSGVDVEFDTGFALAAAVGYHVNKWLAVEFETGFNYNSVDSAGGAPPDGDASLTQVPMLVNVVFELTNESHIIPFAGAGAGASLQLASFDEFDSGISVGGNGLDGSDSDFVFTWQAFAGIRYEFNERMGVGVVYRYMMADGPEWEVDTGTADETLAIDDVESHTITAQFSYRF